MIEFFQNLFTQDFMPHGQCLLWRPEILWLFVISDGIITASYYSIPVALFYFVRRREDLEFKWMFVMFGLFIFSCGSTHFLDIWTLWSPSYRFEGVVKFLTAISIRIYRHSHLAPYSQGNCTTEPFPTKKCKPRNDARNEWTKESGE